MPFAPPSPLKYITPETDMQRIANQAMLAGAVAGRRAGQAAGAVGGLPAPPPVPTDPLMGGMPPPVSGVEMSLGGGIGAPVPSGPPANTGVPPPAMGVTPPLPSVAPPGPTAPLGPGGGISPLSQPLPMATGGQVPPPAPAMPAPQLSMPQGMGADMSMSGPPMDGPPMGGGADAIVADIIAHMQGRQNAVPASPEDTGESEPDFSAIAEAMKNGPPPPPEFERWLKTVAPSSDDEFDRDLYDACQAGTPPAELWALVMMTHQIDPEELSPDLRAMVGKGSDTEPLPEPPPVPTG